MVTWQQIAQGEPNPFDITRTSTDGYTASYDEYVITDQPTINLPSPQQDAAVAVRADTKDRTVTVSTPSGSILDIGSQAYYQGPEPAIFVSDGVDWYVQNDEQQISSFLPDTPTDGLVHRYDPRELDGFSDGDTVTTRLDLIGNDDLTGSATYRPSGFNGNPALEYDGSSDSHIGAFDSAIAAPYDVWVVANVNSSGSDDMLVEDDSADEKFYDPDFSATGEWRLNTPTSNSGNISYSGGSNDIILLGWDNNSVVEVNDTSLFSGDAGDPGTFDGLTIGERKSNDNHLEMTCGEVLIGDPSDPDYSRSTVYQYLVDGWQ